VSDDAFCPYLSLAIPVGTGSVGWKDDLPPAAIGQRLQGFVRERIAELERLAGELESDPA
jgi:hypothetical protein